MEKVAKHTYGRYTVENIYECIRDYDYQLWIAYKKQDNEIIIIAAVVTRIDTYPNKRYVSMAFCGGIDLNIWKDAMLATLRRFAQDNHCDGIEATARPGWAKIFKNDGHKPLWSTFELPLVKE
jgi:hypothetical protein